MNELRRAWEEIVAPDDYDAHMAAIGQGEANAHLLKKLVEDFPLEPTARLLIAGAGTGQMFDYVSPDFLSSYRVVFTDIRQAFLDRLRERLRDATFEITVDDVEAPQIGRIDAAALVLVLEHVNWRKALSAVARSGARRLYLIVQINPPDMEGAVTPGRTLPGTLNDVPPQARPELIPDDVMAEFLRDLGFGCRCSTPIGVADGKTMLGVVFDSAAPPDAE